MAVSLAKAKSALSVVRKSGLLQAKPEFLEEVRHLAVVPTEAGLVALAEQEASLGLLPLLEIMLCLSACVGSLI